MDLMRVTYRLDVEPAEALARAEAIAVEQTVEVPRSVVREAFIEESILGRVESIEPTDDGATLATIAFPTASTALDPAQLLNVLFGMTSLQADATCVDVEFPESILAALQGPRFGIEGLRKATGAYERALTCTAVKPLGRSPEALADLMRAFARAGIDVVKDDQGLADHAFCPFGDRVRACLAAAEEVAVETGHRTLYVPNLIGTPESVFRQLEIAESAGARAVMASPMLIGLPVFWELCRRRASVPVLAHPSFGGVQRFAPAALFGSLYRLYGADAVIFVGYAGRFRTPREACRDLVDALLGPWSGIPPSLPVVGGGVALDNIPELLQFYGRDAMLLVGGSLQVEEGALLERSRAFVRAVHEASTALPDRA
jgi:ribulose-bisphosphate carboxylase large chain